PTRAWGALSLDVLDRLDAHRERVALRRVVDGEWIDVTLGQFHQEVTAAAKGLLAGGVAHGDRVALLAKTRYEWTVLDYANWWIGAVTVPIYETSSAPQIAWILADSGATHVFYENDEHRTRVDEARPEAPTLVSSRPIEDVLTSLAAEGAAIDDETLEARRAAVIDSDLATLIYTSGTTGRPKGCELTHANFRAELWGANERLEIMFAPDDAATLLFLPLAHVFARIVQVGAIRFGSVLGHTADITNLVEHLGQFKPTFVLAVPRVFEKVFNSASTKAYSEGKGKIFDAAVRTAIAYSRATESGKPSLALRAKHGVYDKLVYGKLRAALGGRAKYAISGGAPLGDRLGHFYRGVGLNVFEGYGLTETTAALTVNHPGAQRIGTVGPPLPGVEVRIADDGELQFRGPQVFSAYWNAEHATREVLDDEGWFSTGDLGEVTEDGFVKITGRKKELIVTAGGKNVSPAILEDRVRSHPLVSQCLVVGEGKPFVAALVTIDVEAWEGELDDPELLAQVQKAIDDANSQVSRAEAIRKFAIVEEDWTEENGYLTPSFKVKRHMVVRDLHDTIEALYVR
ncbi:MAG: AMP-binding protein, partial [Aeromicrobium sp.]